MRYAKPGEEPRFGLASTDPDDFIVDERGLRGKKGNLLISRRGGMFKAIERAVLAERDAALVIWRYPEDPDWTVRVFGGPDQIEVAHEPSFTSRRYYAGEKSIGNDAEKIGNIPIPAFDVVAQAWFDAHRQPQPVSAWDEAKLGEAWFLHFEKYEDCPAIVVKRYESKSLWFQCPDDVLEVGNSPQITDARRLWPVNEEESTRA